MRSVRLYGGIEPGGTKKGTAGEREIHLTSAVPGEQLPHYPPPGDADCCVVIDAQYFQYEVERGWRKAWRTEDRTILTDTTIWPLYLRRADFTPQWGGFRLWSNPHSQARAAGDYHLTFRHDDPALRACRRLRRRSS